MSIGTSQSDCRNFLGYFVSTNQIKVNGYVSESVQSDIKLSFTCILFF